MAAPSPHRILLVEDDLGERSITSKILRSNNYDVVEASNGVEALPLLRTKGLHLLVSDLQMPKMDGYALLRIVTELCPQLGVVALSGTLYRPQKTPGRLMADAFFDKGVHGVQEFLNSVANLCELFPMRPVHRRPLSLAWRPHEQPDCLWIACMQCLRCFPISEKTARLGSGTHRTRCPLCSAGVEFMVEEGVSSKGVSGA